MIDNIDAIRALVPDAQMVYSEETVIQWLDERTQPTDEEIAAKKIELQTEYDNNAYARARAIAYPSVTEFMEAYTEKEIGGDSTKWDAYVVNYNKVRTDNPKG